MDESASDIIHNSRANATKYRQVEMTPIMIDQVRREQQQWAGMPFCCLSKGKQNVD